MRSASKRFAFALRRSPSRRRISLSPIRVVLAAVAVVCGRVVVHFHGDVGQPAHGPGCGERASFRQAAALSRRSRAAATRQYHVRAELAGYVPAALPIKVTKATNQAFTLTLKKLPGLLRIDVPAAARVTLDGKEASNAPGEFELPAGRHSVAIQRSAISRSAQTSTSKVSARRRHSSRARPGLGRHQ